MGIEILVLGSSSSGNSTLVRADGCALLIDAGFSMQEVRRRLGGEGVGLEEVHGVLVTHEHADHARGLGRFTKRAGVEVAANEATALALQHTFGMGGIRALENGVAVEFAGWRVRPIRVPHDSADCAGFELEMGDLRMVYATDLGAVPSELVEAGRRSDLVVIESNHDLPMLWAGRYPPFLKERIAGGRGHLSNELAGQAVVQMARGRLKRVVLAHLSQENNRPEAAVGAVKNGLKKSAGIEGFDVVVEAAPKDGPLRVAVA